MKFRITREGRNLLAGLLFLMTVDLITGFFFSGGFRLVSLGIAALCGGLVLFVLYFFRDPERHSQTGPEVILSPADGLVVQVEAVEESRHLQAPAQRVAIFMHVGNVHVQRVPSEARVEWIQHQPGRFRPALDPRAAGDNEQRWYAFTGPRGKYVLVQIAGLLARRTICWLTAGQACARGERLGMIALGSEVDLHLPRNVEIQVRKGMRVKAGESVIGVWR